MTRDFQDARAAANDVLAAAKAYTDAQLKNWIGRVRVSVDGAPDVAARHRLDFLGGVPVVDDPTRDRLRIGPLAAGGAFVGAKAHDTGGIVCASGSITTVALDAEYWDTGALHDLTTNNERIAIPSDGYYRVSARVELERHSTSATADPFYGLLQLLRSGSTVAEDMVSTTPAAFNAGHRIVLKIEEVFHCTAGQYFSLTIQQNAGVAVVTSGDSWRQARLGVERVG
jgi:hypothetical protein